MKLITFFKRTLYLGYYFKELDRDKFIRFFRYTKNQTKWKSIYLWKDIIVSVYRYNIGLMDYFIFRFFEKNHKEREKWAGTGYKYEYDLIMNPKTTRQIIENKLLFYDVYSPFVIHANCSIEDLKKNNSKAQAVLKNKSGKIVVKNALGQCGWNVEVLKADLFNSETLVKYMVSKGFNLAEEFIVQHPELSRLSPSGLNTIRIITQLNREGNVDILGARLRISVNNHVDNLASGNIAAPIDVETGEIIGPGVFSDITKDSVIYHPITKEKIVGFKIPLWNEIIQLARDAALHRPENRSIGWDIALTENGPEFIEGNHNWCQILWQLPVNIGMKEVLERYLMEK
jgi:hypothetical protein